MKILLVGAGLTNAVIYDQLKNDGHEIEVIEKRPHIAGNCYSELKNGIEVHVYGPHIFHTNNRDIWNYVNSFSQFKTYNIQVMATDLKQVYNLPYNMNTFTKIWPEYKTPAEVKAHIEFEIAEYFRDNPYIDNLECAAIKKVGPTVYKKLIKPYTEKQWGMLASKLPKSIIERLPVRFTYNNNYFNDTYQGIPICGYTEMVSRMFNDADIKLNTDFIADGYINKIDDYDFIFYSGPIDRLLNALSGSKYKLPYRSLKFLEIKSNSTQGCAIMTYDTDEVDFTRITESRYFTEDEFTGQTIKTYEYPVDYIGDNEPYYPIENETNRDTYNRIIIQLPSNIIPVGRLGKYRYYNMDKAIEDALNIVNDVKQKK